VNDSRYDDALSLSLYTDADAGDFLH